MELLDYFNYTDKFTYDENNFLKIEQDKDMRFEFRTYIEDKNSLDSPLQNDYVRLFIMLKCKTETYYEFQIGICEYSGYYINTASGNVKIYYDQNGINKVLVNDVENGILEDRYNDCFDITPQRYLHILHTPF